MSNTVYRYEILVTGVMPAHSRKRKESVAAHRHTHSRIGKADISRVNMLWNQLRSQRNTIPADKKVEDDDD